MFLTLFDVIGRAFNHPIAVSVEVTELIMGMMIYLGIGYTTFLKGHIRVDIVLGQLSERIQAVLELITTSIGLVFVVLMCWRLYVKAQSLVESNKLTQIWEVPLCPPAMVMSFASLMMIVALVFHLVENIRAVFNRSLT